MLGEESKFFFKLAVRFSICDIFDTSVSKVAPASNKTDAKSVLFFNN